MQGNRQKFLSVVASVILKYRGNISISKLSNEIGLSKSIWSELEKGKKDIQLSTFCRIAEALEISPAILLKEIEMLLGEDFSFIE